MSIFAGLGGGPDGTAEDTAAPLCSSRGCRAVAVWAHRWNNPRLHTPERRKVWLACDDHRASLADFLGSRGFLRDTVPVGDLAPEDG
ncbi:hypothetical protein [Nocardioides zeae]|uniref:Acetone carboxylase n=1 Tax=Nocardioides zeae TaxID=1457234 RepID=A0AAJ1U218_9ACTN|nr:hypothetical protein [Nocardioides zeae]MDQ1104043.1 hypothetical protein [Nocardioides zeae]